MKDVTLHSKYINIAIVVTAYWFISIFTVFVNKTLLSDKTTGLKAPIIITWFQCLISFLICHVLSKTKGIPGLLKFPEGSPWKVDTIKNVLPLSLLFVGMVATSNIYLQHVGVAFYFVGRSLTTVFNVVLGSILLSQHTSKRCMACCGFIILGFWLGVDQESLIDSFSLFGTVVGVISSILLSMYTIYTKQVLPFVNNEVWLLSYYNNAYSIFLMLPMALMNGEFKTFYNFDSLDNYVFWVQMIIGGFCGFAIGLVTSLQIKVTSPLTHNISGTAKACTQTVIATFWYDDYKSFLWWTSNVIVLLSSALYARFKQLEMEKASYSAKEDNREKQSLV